MPEIKRIFTSGRMNKDLDERLVPQGEYRDAENLQLSTSEGSDVGALQNILGTTLNNIKTYNTTTGASTAHPSNLGYATMKSIGSIVDTQNNKIYWFIAATTSGGAKVSSIAEFDKSTGVIAAVLVDTASILNFSDSYKITGINVIEGMLLWTDNQTEPKQITIDTFKDGTNANTPFLVHTLFQGSNFIEENITAIKKYPLSAPTFEKEDDGTFPTSMRGGTTTAQTQPYNFYSITSSRASNTMITAAQVYNVDVNIQVGDTIRLTYNPGTPNVDLEITILVDSVTDIFSPTGIEFTGTVITKDTRVNDEIGDNAVMWEIDLVENDAFFEYKFPRFAYRWKYKDGQYSCYSPFSEPAFQPGDFEYTSDDGWNIGMVNRARRLTLRGWDWSNFPEDVEEIDILYKESNNNLVYVVDTLKEGETEFEITSEVYGSVVESNQLLRPWDNVPRKAKAQEITANRVVYGNYTQNYNVIKENKPVIVMSMNSDGVANVTSPEKSLKSLRTYQLGVTYLDEYGRETPIFTNKTASKYINLDYSDKANSISAKLTNQPPVWATHFKYYIKETSNEYYNLALDRFYPSEDDNVWLTFPSSERNKVQEGDFLILKKQHDSNVAVKPLRESDGITQEHKFKILKISNEAPEFVREKFKTVVRLEVRTLDTTGGNRPGVGNIGFQFRGPSHLKNPKFAEAWDSEGAFRIEVGGNRSALYPINGASLTSEINPSNTAEDEEEDNQVYDIRLDQPFRETWLDDMTADSAFIISIYEPTSFQSEEFFGRFFVKIPRNRLIQQNIEAAFSSSTVAWGTTMDKRIYPFAYNWTYMPSTARPDLKYTNAPDFDKYKIKPFPKPKKSNSHLNWHAWSDIYAKKELFSDLDGRDIKIDRPNVNGRNSANLQKSFQPDNGRNYMQILVAGYAGGIDSPLIIGHYTNDFLDKISQIGTIIRFGYEARVNRLDSDDGTYMVLGDNLYETTRTIQPTAERRGWRTANLINRKARKRTWNARLVYDIEFQNIGSPMGVTANMMASGIAGTNFVPVGDGTYQEEFYNDPARGLTGADNLYGPLPNGAHFPTHIFIQERVYVDDDNETLSSNNPAIFETEPKEDIDLDIYYEISDAHPISAHGNTQILDWFNCYSFGNGVESNRIRDDFNAVIIDKGPKASTVPAEQYKEEKRKSGLIWSGIFNSKAGINRLNQFIMAEKITKDVNPYYGSIQKLHSRNTDLVTFCEDKIIKILANKDALYNADGNTNLTATENVLGQAIPYIGEYGISDQPESFASHAFRVYFADRSRGAVLRLSRDGLTNIATKGMTDYFNDNLPSSLLMLGSYDESKQCYNLTHTSATKGKDITVSFDERVGGWTSFKSFDPECAESLDSVYYSIKTGNLWSHTNTKRNRFYDVTAGENDPTKYYNSSINIFLNDQPSVVKNFKTLNYEGSKSRIYTYDDDNPSATTNTTGWFCELITTNLQTGGVKEFLDKEGKWFNYIKGESTTWSNSANDGNVDPNEFSVQGLGVVTVCSGATVPTKRNITVTANITNPSGCKVSVGEGTTFTASLSEVISKTINGGTAIVITLTPLPGFVIKASDFTYVEETSLPVTETIPLTDGHTNAQANPDIFYDTGTPDTVGNTVQAKIPLDFTVHASSTLDQTIVVGIGCLCGEKEYSLTAKYHIDEENTDLNDVSNAVYTVSSTENVEEEIAVLDKTFTADLNHYFEIHPTIRITQLDTTKGTYRTVITTTGVGYVEGGFQKKIRFQVFYTPSNVDAIGDEVHFYARAVTMTDIATPLITSYTLNQSLLPIGGESREMTIYGTQGAEYRLNVESATHGLSSLNPSPYNHYVDHVTDGIQNQFTLENIYDAVNGDTLTELHNKVTSRDQITVWVSSVDNDSSGIPPANGALKVGAGELTSSISNAISSGATPGTKTNVAFSTSGYGVGGIIDVVVNGSGAVTAVNVTGYGQGYITNERLTIDSSQIGGSTDLIITLTADDLLDGSAIWIEQAIGDYVANMTTSGDYVRSITFNVAPVTTRYVKIAQHTEWLFGTGGLLGDTYLTMPASGKVTTVVPFNNLELSSQSKAHTFTLTGDLAADFDTPLGQDSTPTIYQYGTVDFSTSIISSTGMFTLPTNKQITKQFTALGEPNDDHPAGEQIISWVVTAAVPIVLDSTKVPTLTTPGFTNADPDTNSGCDFEVAEIALVLSNSDKTLTITATKDIFQYGSASVVSELDLEVFASLGSAASQTCYTVNVCTGGTPYTKYIATQQWCNGTSLVTENVSSFLTTAASAGKFIKFKTAVGSVCSGATFTAEMTTTTSTQVPTGYLYSKCTYTNCANDGEICE